MSIFIIKIIACITMVLDHIKYAIPMTKCFATKYFGRISFPLFAFLTGEGYSHTSNLKKYYKRLIIFAFISQIPFMLFRTLVGEWRMLNILFTLLFGLLCITVYEKIEKKYISILLIVIIVYLSKIVRVDYGWYGVLAVFILYLFRNQKWWRIIAFSILSLFFYWKRLYKYYSIAHLLNFGFTIFPIILLLFYNGKLGLKTKYMYYVFYPVHMMIIYLLSLI